MACPIITAGNLRLMSWSLVPDSSSLPSSFIASSPLALHCSSPEWVIRSKQSVHEDKWEKKKKKANYSEASLCGSDLDRFQLQSSVWPSAWPDVWFGHQFLLTQQVCRWPGRRLAWRQADTPCWSAPGQPDREEMKCRSGQPTGQNEKGLRCSPGWLRSQGWAAGAGTPLWGQWRTVLLERWLV